MSNRNRVWKVINKKEQVIQDIYKMDVTTFNSLELMTVLYNRGLFEEEYISDVLMEVAQRLLDGENNEA